MKQNRRAILKLIGMDGAGMACSNDSFSLCLRYAVALTTLWCVSILSAAQTSSEPPLARRSTNPGYSVVRGEDGLTIKVPATAPAMALALHIYSDRNAIVPRFSDVSPLKPGARINGGTRTRESWYPVIDVAVDDSMEGVVELADIPEGTQLSWNGWVRRELQPAESPLYISADRLLQWENTLWIDRAEPRVTSFYVRQPFPVPTADRPVPTIDVRLLAPDWSGRIEVVGRDKTGRESILYTRAIESLPPAAPVLPRPGGKGLEVARLRASLAAVVDHTLRSQIVDPKDPMHGGLYLFYDLDARTYRTPHWVWGWGPSAGLLLDARRVPEIGAIFGSARLLKAAIDIGETSLRTVSHDPAHPARGIPISRWDRSPAFDFGHQPAITPCDAAFLAGWTWVRLEEATGDPKWRDASDTLAGALERLMTEFPIAPQNYRSGRWDGHVIDEAGFGVELFAEMHRVTGDARMRELGRRYIEQHIAALGRPDGLWDRTHYLDGRPNKPTIRMTRGLGWPMEGLLAAHRLLPEDGRYIDLAGQMAEHLIAAQSVDGWWGHRFDKPVEEWGVGMKGTALWCWLLYELHRHTGEPRHLSAARLALGWLLDEQYFGEDQYARGGHVAVSPHSAVGYRPWFRVTCTYGAAFYGLALLQELQVQESTARPAGAARP